MLLHSRDHINFNLAMVKNWENPNFNRKTNRDHKIPLSISSWPKLAKLGQTQEFSSKIWGLTKSTRYHENKKTYRKHSIKFGQVWESLT